MADDVVTTSRTSARTAEASPIVLRQGKTSRLIFRPVLIDNPNDPAAAVNGDFIYQRKGPKAEWADLKTLPLNKLKADEWVKLELKSAELLTLFNGLSGYYDLVEKHGLGTGTRELIPAPKNKLLRGLLLDEQQLEAAFKDSEIALSLLRGFVRWLSQNQAGVAAAEVEGLDASELQHFEAVLALARLRRFCRELEEQASNSSEAYWQKLLRDNSWVIAQVYSIPVMIVTDQVYVGGKSFANQGGNTADFLYKNRLTENVALVEIKTPTSPIVGQVYRNNVRNTTSELAGATLQLLKSKKSLIENFRSLARAGEGKPLSPRGLLIIGTLDGLEPDQVEGFELFRGSQRDVEIITFDELREKAHLMVELLEGGI